MAPADPTIDSPEPTATGILAKRPLAHLLVFAHHRGLSGTFEFAMPTGETAALLVEGGLLAKARTSEDVPPLEQVLYELGVLNDEQLEIVLPRLRRRKGLLGQLLLAEEMINEEQLELALRTRIVRQTWALVRLPPETTFRYFDGFDGLAAHDGANPFGIDPFPLIWSSIRDQPPWEHVELGLAGVGLAGLRLTAASETGRFTFDETERALVELLRQKPWRIAELLAAGTVDPSLAQRLLYCLLVTKQVELVSESEFPRPESLAPEVLEDEGVGERPSSPFAEELIDPALAPVPRAVARLQLAQRRAVRPPPVFEEVSRAWEVTDDRGDGRTSYVATQPRTGKKRGGAT